MPLSFLFGNRIYAEWKRLQVKTVNKTMLYMRRKAIQSGNSFIRWN